MKPTFVGARGVGAVASSGSGRPAARIPVYIRATGLRVDDADRAYLRNKLRIKLGKFHRALERVSVRIGDANGPRGGKDKMCTIKVVLTRAPSIVVAHQDASLKTAMDAAMQRAERTVRRTVQRRNVTRR